MKQKHIEEWQHSRKGLSTNSFTLSSLFGGSSQVCFVSYHPSLFSPPPQAQASPIPPTYLEQKRREAQLQYQEEQAYIRANKENFERMLKEEQEAMEREMRGGTVWSTMQTMLAGGPPPQPGQGQQQPASAQQPTPQTTS